MADQLRTVDTPNPESAAALVEAERANLLTLEGELLRPRLSGTDAVGITNQLFASAHAVEPYTEVELSAKRAAKTTEALDLLGHDARVYAATDSLADLPADSLAKEIDALAEKVAAYDDEFTMWSVPAFKNHPELADTLAEIKKGRGRADGVHDVDRFVALFGKHLAEVSVRIPEITKAKLEDAGSTATKLKLLMQKGPNTKGSPKDLKNRAYTKWRTRLQDLTTTIGYLADLHPEANTPPLPALLAKPKPKAKPKQVEPEASTPAEPITAPEPVEA